MKINLNLRLNPMCFLGVLVITILLSCSADSELLADYVSNDNPLASNVIDDHFTIVPRGIKSLSVLENDTFSDDQDVIITYVSTPKNGQITLNDNIIDYVAPDTSSETVDTFTYTTKTTGINGESISDTGNVTITITNDPNAANSSYLFTDQAKNTLKERFEKDYVTGPGFTSDFRKIKDVLSIFLADPSKHRPTLGINSKISSEGEIIHMAGLYTFAMDDVKIANVVAKEILETIQNNNLDGSFWDTNHNFSSDYDLFIQTAKVKKLKDTYYLVKGIATILSENDKNTINKWFEDYKNLILKWLVAYLENYFGSNWENVGITKAKPEGLYPIGYGDPFPIKNSDGTSMIKYGVSWFQNGFNNRMLDNVSYLHSWAVYNEDLDLEYYTREYFKAVIRYGTWSDGTFWEVVRNTPSDNTLGVFYTNVSLTSLVYMAHVDALANHYPNDKLYDFKTTEGIINGSTNLTISPYLGGSTTDGITEKSIKTLIMGQSKYLKSSAFGGWNNLRYNNGSPMSAVNKRSNSVIAAIANIYYDDQDLKDYYLYNTSAGYPLKAPIYEGWGKNEDYGAWGNLIIGGAWFEQENNFFN